MTLECTFGRIDSSPTFAQQIARSGQRQSALQNQDRTSVLMIGVPIRSKSRTLGVLQVITRPVTNEGTQRGYAQFMEQMARILAECPAFSTGV
jgi:hypothetical protein